MQELAGGTPTANLLTGFGYDEYFTRTDSAGVRNYLSDALGSSVALTDGSGAVQTEYAYEPFGATTASGASTTNAFGFTGREADGTGLHYYRARYYDARRQRFISEDPIGFDAGDANLHAYVWNAPGNWVDPLGLAVMAGMPGCNARKDPVWITCNPTLIGVGPLLGAAASAAAAAGWGGAGAASGAGGAAATAAAAAAPIITFGHGARHLANTGLSAVNVEAAIMQQAQAIARTASQMGNFYGRIDMNGVVITYRAYPLPNNVIHIGTYYPPR